MTATSAVPSLHDPGVESTLLAAERRLQDELSSIRMQISDGFSEIQRMLNHATSSRQLFHGASRQSGSLPSNKGPSAMTPMRSAGLAPLQQESRASTDVDALNFGSQPSSTRVAEVHATKLMIPLPSTSPSGGGMASRSLQLGQEEHPRDGSSVESPRTIADTGRAFVAVPTVGNGATTHSLWDGWPENVQLREDLILGSEEENKQKLRNFAVSAVKTQSVATTQVSEISSVFCRFLKVIHPASRQHIAFDLLCMLVIFLQVIYLPYAMVWQAQVADMDTAVLLTTSIFWLADMVFHFITGFYNAEGEVEMRLPLVIKHYLQTWFAPDLLCVSSDLLNLATEVVKAESNPTATRILHIIKVQRFLRALVMLRMLRAAKVIYDYMESQMSAAWIVLLRTLQFSVLILWMTHVVACAWFALGKYAAADSHGTHWIDMSVSEVDDRLTFANSDVLYQYSSSYHWALAQMTLGGSDINPTNSWERLLAIVCNFIGLFFGGVVVSILATTMISLRDSNRDRELKMRRLREFLLQHGVDIGIRLRVVRQVHDRMIQTGKTLVEKDVSAMKVLSTTMLRELRYNLYSRLVLKHPLLHSWTLLQPDSIKYFCNEGISLLVLLPDDELFTVGMPGKAAYLLREGRLSYTPRPMGDSMEHEDREELHEGAWISEAAWWCYWHHVGTACAHKPSTLLNLPADTVLHAMHLNPVVCAITIEYGIRFHSYIVSAEEKPVTDTNVQYVDFNGLFCTLPTEVHVILGMAALQRIVSTPLHWRLERTGNLRRLEEEIREGRSLVLFDQSEVLHRRVALTVVQVGREDEGTGPESFLTQVAAYDFETSKWKPDLRLPGVKQRVGEAPQQAFQRCLETRLPQLNNRLTPLEWTRKIENQHSKKFGVGTQYIKTTGIVPMTLEIDEELAKFGIHLHLGAQSLGGHVSSSAGWSSVAAAAASMPWSNPDPEDLTDMLQEDKVFILGSRTKALYVLMTCTDFHRLEVYDHLLSNLVLAMTPRLDPIRVNELLGWKAPVEPEASVEVQDFIIPADALESVGLGSPGDISLQATSLRTLPSPTFVMDLDGNDLTSEIQSNPASGIHKVATDFSVSLPTVLSRDTSPVMDL
mmetsp:Transcript_11897/g.27739  ORF Transcript_11897/g.27739 Transcript_11897/m.27739 type:complete len:1107 (+) Transcript_11897:188-3508(+)